MEQVPPRTIIKQRNIVLLTFPFSDMTGYKVRPAIVMSSDRHDKRSLDFIAVPLTSNTRLRDNVVSVTNRDLEAGHLIVDSVAKVDRIFSIEKSLVRASIGRVKREIHERIRTIIHDLLSLPE